jgi:hypothetical protein
MRQMIWPAHAWLLTGSNVWLVCGVMVMLLCAFLLGWTLAYYDCGDVLARISLGLGVGLLCLVVGSEWMLARWFA